MIFTRSRALQRSIVRQMSSGLPPSKKVRVANIEELEKLHGKRVWLKAPPVEPPTSKSGLFGALPMALSAGVTLAGLYWITAPPDDFHPTARDPHKHLPADLSTLVKVKGNQAVLKHKVEEEVPVVEKQEIAPVVEEVPVAVVEEVTKEQPVVVVDVTEDDKIDIIPSDVEQRTAPVITEVKTEPTAEKPPTASNNSYLPEKNILKAKYVIVGGGSASYAAMKAIQDREPGADILILSAESQLPYMRPPLSKELWHSKDPKVADNLKFNDWGGAERELFYETEAAYRLISDPNECNTDNDVQLPKLMLNQTVVGMDVDSQLLTLNSGLRVKYSRVLLATGGRPKQLPLLDNASEQVKQRFSTFRTVQDFQRLESMVCGDQPKTILIVGGGFLGSELACSIAYRGTKCGGSRAVQLYPEDGNMALVFPKYLVQWTTERIQKRKCDYC